MFDPDDAYDWVVRHLPDLVAATLTPEDVRRILDFQLEFFKRKGVRRTGRASRRRARSSSGPAETIEYILERSAETGESYLPEQVEGVVECQLAYLRFIGAVGPAAAGPDERRAGDPRRRIGTRTVTEFAPRCLTALYIFRYQRREVVQTMHDQRFGTLEVRGR